MNAFPGLWVMGTKWMDHIYAERSVCQGSSLLSLERGPRKKEDSMPQKGDLEDLGAHRIK